jgi:hypothetical protein
MKTTSQKNSFGGGYGINRNVSAGNALTVAEPAMKGVSVKPGNPTLVPRKMGHTPGRKK